MPRPDTRERIMQATVRTLSVEGYSKTTARAIGKTGGFAPGVIYYHFADIGDLFAATATYTSERRLERYRAETAKVSGATDLIGRLRVLYQEDESSGHIAAIQELVAAAVTSPQLAETVRAETARWQEFAEDVLNGLLGDSPMATLLPVAELAAAAVATYLGLEMLSHLHAERYGAPAMFDAATRLAPLIDVILAK